MSAAWTVASIAAVMGMALSACINRGDLGEDDADLEVGLFSDVMLDSNQSDSAVANDVSDSDTRSNDATLDAVVTSDVVPDGAPTDMSSRDAADGADASDASIVGTGETDVIAVLDSSDAAPDATVDGVRDDDSTIPSGPVDLTGMGTITVPQVSNYDNGTCACEFPQSYAAMLWIQVSGTAPAGLTVAVADEPGFYSTPRGTNGSFAAATHDGASVNGYIVNGTPDAGFTPTREAVVTSVQSMSTCAAGGSACGATYRWMGALHIPLE